MMSLLKKRRFRLFVILPIIVVTILSLSFYFYSKFCDSQAKSDYKKLSEGFIPLIETYIKEQNNLKLLQEKLPNLKVERPFVFNPANIEENETALFWQEEINSHSGIENNEVFYWKDDKLYFIQKQIHGMAENYLCFILNFQDISSRTGIEKLIFILLTITITLALIIIVLKYGQNLYLNTVNDIFMRAFMNDTLPLDKLQEFIPDKKFLKKVKIINSRLQDVKKEMDDYIVKIDEEVDKRTKELKNINNFLSKIIDNELIGIVLTDSDFKISSFNKGAARITSFTENEIKGNNFLDILKPKFRVDEIKENLTKHSYFEIFETNILNKNNKQTSIYLSGSYFYQEYESQQNCLFIIVDISEQKQLYKQLLHSQKMENMGMLAGGLAHDFNNILGSITGYANLLKGFLNENIEAKEMAEIIESSGMRASELIRSLLNYAKGIKQKDEFFDINIIIDETYLLLKKTISKNINFEVKMQPELFNVKGNASQIQQCIINLCLNAKDAMPDGGNLSIEVENVNGTKENVNKFVKVTVIDNGIGIKKEIKEQLFDPFFSTKDKSSSTGLGLTMVNKIISDHNGTIDIKSLPNERTIFTLLLPALTKKKPVEEIKAEYKKIDGTGKTILIVDDEESILMLLEQFLNRFNFKSLSAINGKEGIEVLDASADDIDIVILDYMMPELNGEELFDYMKEKYPNIPGILLTGVEDEKIIERFIEKGITSVIRKPFTGADVVENIHNALKDEK